MDDFDRFVAEAEPRLRRALVALRGPEDGRDAVAEALAYAWEHWDAVRLMTNPVGYLYRVGQSRSRPRRNRAWRRRDGTSPAAAGTVGVATVPDVEPRLAAAMSQLSDHQRVAVFLVHGCQWTHGEIAELIGCSPSTVSTHVQRALARLRDLLEVDADATA